MLKNFAITGVAGYIAPRHLQAIHETENNLIAALDTHDSVGILDRYFPGTSFFTEFERFDRHLEKLKRRGESERAHYVTICVPNHLHDAHIRFSLRIGAHAICEKPLVLNPWNLDALEELEQETERSVFTILQLRVHPSLIDLKKKIDQTPASTKYNVVLTYITSRGIWYDYSWKGVPEKSGGIGTNIGIHFFDLLIWLFGNVQRSELHLSESKRMSGFLELEKATVQWYLSIAAHDLPEDIRIKNKTTYRSITINGEEIQFSEGFTDLHTRVYEETVAGRGFGIKDARASIELAYQIRKTSPYLNHSTAHPKINSIKRNPK